MKQKRKRSLYAKYLRTNGFVQGFVQSQKVAKVLLNHTTELYGACGITMHETGDEELVFFVNGKPL